MKSRRRNLNVPGHRKSLGHADQVCIRPPEQFISPASSTLPCMRLWTERYRQRRALFNLADADTHLLDDIDLLRDDAMREAAKRFWLR